MNNKIMDPLEFYNTSGAEALRKNAVQFFDGRLEQAGIDEAANRALAEAYERAEAQCREERNERKDYIIFSVVALLLVVGGFAFISMYDTSWAYILLGVLMCALGGVWFIKKLSPALKMQEERIRGAEQKAQALAQQARAQLEPLEKLLSPRDSLDLIQQTVPELVFHDSFSRDHYDALRNFDFRDDDNKDSSVIRSLTGTLNGNPFAFLEHLTFEMRKETYTGKRTIEWTENVVEKDKKGNEVVKPRRRTQTKSAEFRADKPYFYTYATLGYGHETAPELSFSRKPGKVHELGDNRLEGKVRRGKWALEWQSRQALRRGQDFLPMANEEFEVLFGATDRNNEHQFRQMFTPQAQRSMTRLLRDGTLGGDTFSFRKKRRFNTISCSEKVFRESPRKWHDYSVQKAREAFVKYQEEYFHLIFSAFAPLLAVPLYWERSAVEPVSTGLGQFSPCEHEMMANQLPRELLVTGDCETRAILKTSLISTSEQGDLIRVWASGFTTYPRVAAVEVSGWKDKRTHFVDVEWDEYISRTKVTTVLVGRATEEDMALTQQPGTVFHHGLFAKIMDHKEEDCV